MKRIIVVLDESGSMGERGKREETISGFNKWLEEQQALPADGTLATLIKFNTQRSTVYSDRPLPEVPKLTPDTYTPAGMTALLDAVAAGCSVAADEPALVVVLTDGEENASQETTLDQVRQLIDARQKAGWQFHFVGQGPGAWCDSMAKALNIPNVSVNADSAAGVRSSLSYTAGVSTRYRTGG